MYDLLIICRTLTSAQRVQRALTARGWRSAVIRTPPSVWRDGCGWSVRVNNVRPQDALDAIKGVRPEKGRIYRLENGMPMEEVSG